MQINDLPTAPSGYTTWRYQVGVDGRVSALFSTVAFPRGERPWPSLPSDAACILAILEVASWRPITTFACRDYWYLWDIAPDDWCVVAPSRARGSEPTATAFIDGRAQTPFYIGDGVSHVQCDAEGGIWVGYFDEGVFAADATFGANGLVRLTRTGEKLFTHPGYEIVDCYALNVTRDRTWACTYTEFPIISMTMSGTVQQWDNPSVAGPHCIAAHRDQVALIGGYEADRDRVALLFLEKDFARVSVKTKLATIFPGLAENAQIIARGNGIYAFEAGRYRVCTVTDLESI